MNNDDLIEIGKEMVKLVRKRTFEHAIKIVEGNAPDNEPGEYWKGRRAAVLQIKEQMEKENL